MVALAGMVEVGAPPIGGAHAPPGSQGPAPARFGPVANQRIVPRKKVKIRKASLRMRMTPERRSGDQLRESFPEGARPYSKAQAKEKGQVSGKYLLHEPSISLRLTTQLGNPTETTRHATDPFVPSVRSCRPGLWGVQENERATAASRLLRR